MGESRAFRVRVRHNVVCSLGPVPMNAEVRIPGTKLEVSTQLAQNHRERGCIDGDYYFDNADRAKYFAFLCQDFVKKLVDRTTDELERVRDQPVETWRNPFSPLKDDE